MSFWKELEKTNIFKACQDYTASARSGTRRTDNISQVIQLPGWTGVSKTALPVICPPSANILSGKGKEDHSDCLSEGPQNTLTLISYMDFTLYQEQAKFGDVFHKRLSS